MLPFFHSAIKMLSNSVEMKSILSNIFKEQLSKNSPSAALPLRRTCKQKQNKNPLSQVYRIPRSTEFLHSGPLGDLGDSGSCRLYPQPEINMSQQIRNFISINLHLLEEAPPLPAPSTGWRTEGHEDGWAQYSCRGEQEPSSQLGQGRADGFSAVQTNCRARSPSF